MRSKNLTIEGMYSDWLIYITNHPDFNRTIRHKFSAWPFFRHCEFNLMPCNFSDFNFYYNNLYGNFFKVSDSSVSTKKIYREDDGFDIELITGFPDNIPIYLYARSSFYQPNHIGISVSIFDQDNILLKPNIREVFIKPGTYTKIKVWALMFFNLNPQLLFYETSHWPY